MKDFPKTIETAGDIEHLMSYVGTPFFTQENKDKGLAFLKSLLNTKHHVFDRVLAPAEAADGVELDFRVIENQGANNDERHQFIFAENPNAKLHKIGLTVAEVQSKITQIEGAA